MTEDSLLKLKRGQRCVILVYKRYFREKIVLPNPPPHHYHHRRQCSGKYWHVSNRCCLRRSYPHMSDRTLVHLGRSVVHRPFDTISWRRLSAILCYYCPSTVTNGSRSSILTKIHLGTRDWWSKTRPILVSMCVCLACSEICFMKCLVFSEPRSYLSPSSIS